MSHWALWTGLNGLVDLMFGLHHQIEQRMEKGILLQRTKSHPCKGDILHASNNSIKETGRHQTKPHSLRRCPQSEDAMPQQRNIKICN